MKKKFRPEFESFMDDLCIAFDYKLHPNRRIMYLTKLTKLNPDENALRKTMDIITDDKRFFPQIGEVAQAVREVYRINKAIESQKAESDRDHKKEEIAELTKIISSYEKSLRTYKADDGYREWCEKWLPIHRAKLKELKGK